MLNPSALRALAKPGVIQDVNDVSMVETVFYLANELIKVDEMRNQAQAIRDATVELARSWKDRPSTVLAQAEVEAEGADVSSHVVVEAELQSDDSLDLQVRLASKAAGLQVVPASYAEHAHRIKVELCVQPAAAGSLEAVNPFESIEEPPVKHVQHTAYLIWALLVANHGVRATSGTLLQYTTTLPERDGGQSLSSAQFRSQLGMRRLDVRKKEAGGLLVPSRVAEVKWLTWGDDSPWTFTVTGTAGGNSGTTMDTGELAEFRSDPVIVFMLLDLLLRNPKPEAAMVSLWSQVKEDTAMYRDYACVYNMLTNENWLNAALRSRLTRRPVVHAGRASYWYSSLRTNSNLQLHPGCVGYVAGCVNLILTPDKIIAPEALCTDSPPRLRMVLFLLCSSQDPYESSQAVLIVDPGGTDVHYIGIPPAWFGDAHIDAVLAWLQVHSTTRFRLWAVIPMQVISGLLHDASGVQPVLNLLAGKEHSRLLRGVPRVQKPGRAEPVSVLERDTDEFTLAVWPIFGPRQAETGAIEDAEAEVGVRLQLSTVEGPRNLWQSIRNFIKKPFS